MLASCIALPPFFFLSTPLPWSPPVRLSKSPSPPSPVAVNVFNTFVLLSIANSEVGKNVTNAASGKARGSDTSKASSDWFRWGTPSSVSSGEGETAKPDRNRRDVDPDLIKSGVIDVDGD